MARLKIYTVPEHRHSTLSPAIAALARTGSHGQGDFYVAAHTKAAAIDRLRELDMWHSASMLRTINAFELPEPIARLLLAPGDLVAWGNRVKDSPIVHVYGADTRPAVCGHWRYGQTGPHALDRDIYLEIDCDDLAH